jgi:hypothetical protein
MTAVLLLKPPCGSANSRSGKKMSIGAPKKALDRKKIKAEMAGVVIEIFMKCPNQAPNLN